MKRILTIAFILISITSYSQVLDTSNVRFTDNTNWLKSNAFYPKRALIVPSFGLYGNDTTSKIAGQIKRVGGSLYFCNGVSWQKIHDLSSITNNDLANWNGAKYDSLGIGGHMTVGTLAERNDIPTSQRKEGMTVYVRDTQKEYLLINGGWQQKIEMLYDGFNTGQIPYINAMGSIAPSNIYQNSEGELVIGTNAAGSYVGSNIKAWGNSALINGQGDNKIAIGVRALRNNIGNNSIAIGDYTLQNSDGSNNTALGYAAGATTFTNNSTLIGYNANARKLIDSMTISAENIRVGSKKIGGLSSFFSRNALEVAYKGYFEVDVTGDVLPLVNDGLGRRSLYTEKGEITHIDTLNLYMADFADKGTNAFLKIKYYQNLENISILGTNAEADESNQIILGDSNVTQLKVGKSRDVYPANAQTYTRPNKSGTYAMLDDITTGTSDIEITDYTKGVILRSPNGTRWRLTINDDGTLTATSQ